MRRLSHAYLALVLAFLYLPILVMVVMAFNRSALYELPFTFDLVWFKALATNERLLAASWNSVWIAACNAVIATFLGTLAAMAFARYTFRGKLLMQILLFPPITIPWLIIGTSMLIFFFWTGIGRGLHAILLGHVALSLPYVIVVVGARLQSFGPALEEAAATLGATPVQTFVRVTLPMIAPGSGRRRRSSPLPSPSTSSSSPTSWRRPAPRPCRSKSIPRSARASRRRSTPSRPSSLSSRWG